jgi:hypothetical protein
MTPPTPQGRSKKDGVDHSLAPLRTYKDDVARTIQEEQVTVSQMVLAENARRDTVGEARARASRERRAKILGGLALIVGGMALIYVIGYTFTTLSERHTERQRMLFVHDILYAEQREFVPVRSTTPTTEIHRVIEQGLTASDGSRGSIRGLYFVERALIGTDERDQAVTLSTFVDRAGVNIPAHLARALAPAFFLGVHFGETPAPFLVLKVNDYASAFQGMLDWEQTIAYDLGELLHTQMPDAGLVNIRASDTVIGNRDSRAIHEGERAALYYMFFDRSTIVIAPRSATLTEVARRLASPRIER